MCSGIHCSLRRIGCGFLLCKSIVCDRVCELGGIGQSGEKMVKKFSVYALSIDIKLWTESLGDDGKDPQIVNIQRIDPQAIALSKLKMGYFVRKVINGAGYPKPDDQELYQKEYSRLTAKERLEEAKDRMRKYLDKRTRFDLSDDKYWGLKAAWEEWLAKGHEGD